MERKPIKEESTREGKENSRNNRGRERRNRAKKSGVKEQTKEDDEMGNIVDPYYELQQKSSG